MQNSECVCICILVSGGKPLLSLVYRWDYQKKKKKVKNTTLDGDWLIFVSPFTYACCDTWERTETGERLAVCLASGWCSAEFNCGAYKKWTSGKLSRYDLLSSLFAFPSQNKFTKMKNICVFTPSAWHSAWQRGLSISICYLNNPVLFLGFLALSTLSFGMFWFSGASLW